MRLSKWLSEQGMSAEKAAALGIFGNVTGQAVRHWMAGQRMPQQKHLSLIHQATDGQVTANDFMEACQEYRAREDAA